MPSYRKKKTEAVFSVPCPLRGHRHDLPLQGHPDRPDLVVAYCDDRAVFQAAAGTIYAVAGDSSVYSVPVSSVEGV